MKHHNQGVSSLNSQCAVLRMGNAQNKTLCINRTIYDTRVNGRSLIIHVNISKCYSQPMKTTGSEKEADAAAAK